MKCTCAVKIIGTVAKPTFRNSACYLKDQGRLFRFRLHMVRMCSSTLWVLKSEAIPLDLDYGQKARNGISGGLVIHHKKTSNLSTRF